MVDDRTQRPFGSNEPARSAPKAGASSGNAQLADLARLIGNGNPFGEFGATGAAGTNVRRASAPPAHEPPQVWTEVPESEPELPPPPPPPSQQSTQEFFAAQPAPSVLPPNFGRPPFGNAAPNDDLYHVENGAPPFAGAPVPGYGNDPYAAGNPPFGPEQDDFYEEEPASRKRMGILVIAGIFALAVVGTAGAFGYRALFGSSSTSVPPPVIKADTQPSKIVPAAPKDPQSNKQITDRINDKGLGERLVSREEQPVAITPQPDAPQQSSAPPSAGSGVVGGAEPKKVRTIAIRPDQGTPEAAAPAPVPAPAAPAQAAPVRVIPTSKPAAAPPPRVTNNPPPADDAEPAPPRQAAAAARPAAANAPLSLNPNAAPARAPAPAPVARTAAVAPSQPVSSGGGYLVQVSSQRSEAEAQAAFASLQGKFPSQLGGRQAVIRKVELGEKGTYYRAMVPAGDSAQANEMCSGIKAAGGSCLVQKN